MGSLAFERELRDDPALAAEYRRLAALRDAIRRHAPREAAPQALADRIAALTASAPATPRPRRPRPRPRRSRRFGGARGSTAARWRWRPLSVFSALRSAQG